MHSDTTNQEGLFCVNVHYKDANRALVYGHASMTYIKGTFYCVLQDNVEFKHPIANIWRVAECCVPIIKNIGEKLEE